MNVIFRLHYMAQKTNNVFNKSFTSSSLLVRMDTINDSSTEDDLSSDSPNPFAIDFSFAFQFWFSLIFQIPSIICYIVVLTYILAQRTQRQALHNHSILVLLFIAFAMVLFDYSWKIDSFRRGGNVWPQIPFLCEIWLFLDFGFYNACTVVLAWSSFERHILIFHSHLIATKRQRLLIHYFPLLFILIYLTIFYIYVIFFPPCENQYDFTSPVCGDSPCYIYIKPLAAWDTVVHGVVSTCLIAIFNSALLIRVLWQKRQHRRDWRKYRKIAFQLLYIAALYLSINLPLIVIFLAQLTGHAGWGTQLQLDLLFFCNLLQWLLPFASLTCLSDGWPKIKAFITRNNRRVIPTTTTLAIKDRQHETRF